MVRQLHTRHAVPGGSAVGGFDSAQLRECALVSHEGDPFGLAKSEHSGLQPMPHARQRVHATEPPFGIKPQQHRVLDAKLEVHRQHHAAIGQRQWHGAHQMAGVPKPGQRQHAHRFQAKVVAARLAIGLAQVQNAAGSPTAQTGGHHKQVHPALAIEPGDRISKAAHAESEHIGHRMAIHHEAGRRPDLRGTIKPRHRDLHVWRAFGGASKPESREQG